MSTTHVERLFAHMAWADEAVARALAALERPAPELLALYAHVLAAELVWLDRIEGRAASVPVWPEATAGACADLARAARARTVAIVGALRGAELSRAIAYTNSAGAAFPTPLEDILLHMALHGSYHRGQIARGLRQAGEAPPSTDYIAFVRGAPSATRPPQAPPEGR